MPFSTDQVSMEYSMRGGVISSMAALGPILVVGILASPAIGDLPAEITVNGGSTATVTLSITLSSDLGTETQTDSVTVPVGGGGSILLYPDYEPFNGVELTTMQFSLGNGNLDYEFLCTPTFGCVDVAVSLTNISATLAQVTGATIIDTGRADFFAPWNLRADYAIESILFSSSGNVDTTAEVNFGTTWVASGGNIFVHELTLGSIASNVPGDGFPDNVEITLLTEVNLANATMSGTYDEPPPAACGSGGPCNTIHADSGCDDLNCCIAVCEADFYCCENPWDFSCVQLAINTCGLAPDNDDCANATVVGLGRHPFTTINSATDGGSLITECLNTGQDNSFTNDVWFTYTAKANNGILVSTCDLVDFDTQLAVYDQCNGTLIACNNDGEGCQSGHSRVGFVGFAGQTYLIRVGGVNQAGTGELDIAWGDVAPPPPALSVAWSTQQGGNGHHYALYALDAYSTYEDVLAAAAQFGGYPATITSPQEQAFINWNMPATLLGGPTAIGLFQEGDDEPAGGWRWVGDEPLDWTNWRAGEPNEHLGLAEDWGIMYPDGTWNDNPDYFGNVLIEFDDDPELSQVTWPRSEAGNGHTYEAVILPERVSWDQARAYAIARGGMLVCLETEAEAAFVYERLASFVPLWTMTDFNGGPWIGLYNEQGSWQWLSGIPMDWPGWGPSEPNGTGDRACWYGSTEFFDSYEEDFTGTPTGERFGDAEYADVFGNNRLKLVADSFQSTWGSWVSPPLGGTIVRMEASCRFSFKNEDGGPGDGFSFFWGDMSDTSDNRAQGGEWGVLGFLEDGQGLTVGVPAYPAAGANGVDARWGGAPFVQTPFDFSSVTYQDYQQAGQPENMPTMYVNWERDEGLSVAIAMPGEVPETLFSGAGTGELSSIDPTNWNIGFAGRNGAIDMDILIGDVDVDYQYLPAEGTNEGGPRNTFDDTYNDNVRTSLIIEYPLEESCLGDLNDDGLVDGADLGLLLGGWGACTSAPCVGDLNEDGLVDGADLGLMLGAWGFCN